LHQAFSETEDIEIIGESEMGDKTFEMVADFSPEVVLLDIGMPLFTGWNGFIDLYPICYLNRGGGKG